MSKEGVKYHFSKYFLTYLFFIQGTIFLPNKRLIYSSFFALSAFVFFQKKLKISTSFAQFNAVILCVLMIQILLFQSISIPGIFRLFMTFLFPYFLMRSVGINYLRYYVNIMIYISIISFIFQALSYASESFHQFLSRIPYILGTDPLNYQNFIIYTFERYYEDVLRNSGNFYEPGYFASMLNLALGINFLYTDKIFSKKNLILIVAILTTFSTSGYLGLFFILTVKTLIVSKSKYKILMVPFMLLIGYQSYTRLDFLEAKIETHMTLQIDEKVNKGRFGAARLDWEEIKENPLFGRGIIKATRFDDMDHWDADGAGRPMMNSLTSIWLRLGTIGYIIYWIFLYRSLSHFLRINALSQRYMIMFMGVILITSFSQPMLFTTIYASLLFLRDFKLSDIQQSGQNA